jgi:hypothetical protein
MKHIFSCILSGFCMCCVIHSVSSQRLLYSSDTVTLASCNPEYPLVGPIWITNNTDEQISLRWILEDYYYPHDGSYFMVFEPYHVFPNAPMGQSEINAHDSAGVFFYMYNAFLWPGDTTFVRIRVFDENVDDKIGQALTAIQYCPQTTGTAEQTAESLIQVYPNPVWHDAFIKLPVDNSFSTLILYSTTGELIRKVPVANHEITLSCDGLPEGMYFLALESRGQILEITRIVVVE